MIFIQIPVGDMLNFTYMIGDEETGLAVVVDPSLSLDKVLEALSKNSLKATYIMNTHSHYDHTSESRELSRRTGARIVMHEEAEAYKDIGVKDGDVISVGGLKMKFIHTPGHTPDSICLLVENKLLTGDTLFVGSCGRTDLPGGSHEDLYESLYNKLMKLDESIEVYPGHDYGDKPSSTIGYEKKHNPILRVKSMEEFMRLTAGP